MHCVPHACVGSNSPPTGCPTSEAVPALALALAVRSDLPVLHRLHRLEALDVGWCTGLGDDDAEALRCLGGLRELSLARTKVRGAQGARKVWEWLVGASSSVAAGTHQGVRVWAGDELEGSLCLRPPHACCGAP